jgi:hypothetical protein
VSVCERRRSPSDGVHQLGHLGAGAPGEVLPQLGVEQHLCCGDSRAGVIDDQALAKVGLARPVVAEAQVPAQEFCLGAVGVV